jgi:hypothetical protein
MDSIVLDTIKQIIVMTSFCRKVSIPFRVYLFTSGNPPSTCDTRKHRGEPTQDFKLVEVLNSQTKNQQLETDMYHIFAVAKDCSGYNSAGVSTLLRTNGTPLTNTVFLSRVLIDEFKAATKVDKICCVFITDGDSTYLENYHRDTNGTNCSSGNEGIIVREKNGVANKIPQGAYQLPGNIARWIQNTRPFVSMSHIYLGRANACKSYLNRYDESLTFDEAKFTKDNVDTHAANGHNWPLLSLIDPACFRASSASSSKFPTDDTGMTLSRMLKKRNSSKKILNEIISSFA